MLAGKKTILTFSVALAVALYQHFVEPIPAIEALPGGQETWDIAVAVAGLVLRFVTRGPVTVRDLWSIVAVIRKVRNFPAR